jgi:hypothetical protein
MPSIRSSEAGLRSSSWLPVRLPGSSALKSRSKSRTSPLMACCAADPVERALDLAARAGRRVRAEHRRRGLGVVGGGRTSTISPAASFTTPVQRMK